MKTKNPNAFPIGNKFGFSYMVDDTRLELVTSRTSSGCATSCANRPFFSSATSILPDADEFVNSFFQFLT